MLQTTLFEEPPRSRQLPILGTQKDITYLGATPRSVLNGPAATGMGWWSINPYVGCAFGCAYCYARYAHRYAAERLAASGPAIATAVHEAAPGVEELPAWLAFERRILVKRDAGAILRRALRSPTRLAGLRRDGVVIGTATDPYQPAERRFRLTRDVLEALAEHAGVDVSIITKSPLVTRDVDLLARINERAHVTVHVSLITVDRELARRIEPRAPTPEARLRAIARLRAHDIEVGVNAMPVLPGITDAPDMIDALVHAVADAGASYLSACALRLRSTARDRYLPFIDAEFPQLAASYRQAYGRGHQVGAHYRDGLREQFTRICARHGLSFGRGDGEDEGEEREVAPAEEPTPPSSQLVFGFLETGDDSSARRSH